MAMQAAAESTMINVFTFGPPLLEQDACSAGTLDPFNARETSRSGESRDPRYRSPDERLVRRSSKSEGGSDIRGDRSRRREASRISLRSCGLRSRHEP